MMIEEPIRSNEGVAPGLELGKYVAMDCEMVGIRSGVESALGRVSLVDYHGRQVYDSFVRPVERVTDWRTHVSGLSPVDMVMARNFADVRAQIKELLKGRILVGHDLRHDLEALQLAHPDPAIRDTARFYGFKKYGNGPKPKLKTLAKEILGVDIQNGQHSSVEDARVAMLLFRKYKQAFDADHLRRYPDTTKDEPAREDHGKNPSKMSKKNKKNKKRKH
jgi:RNA exonuclease 4